MTNTIFNDQDMLTDLLTSQKHTTDSYNEYANEAAHPEIKDILMSILGEEHDIQHEVFCQMQSHGWYQVEDAEAQKVTQARQKFSGMQL